MRCALVFAKLEGGLAGWRLLLGSDDLAGSRYGSFCDSSCNSAATCDESTGAAVQPRGCDGSCADVKSSAADVHGERVADNVDFYRAARGQLRGQQRLR